MPACPIPALSKNRRPIAVDLFAGAGGFSLGIEQAGFDVAVAVEVNPIHAATHQFNAPHTKVLQTTVEMLTGSALRQAIGSYKLASAIAPCSSEQPQAVDADLQPQSWDGEIDLVIGGPPCQGFSAMGKRLRHDDRNNLVFQFCRLIAELQPSYFVMENVPGMAVARYDALWERLIQQFEQAGYVVQPRQTLNAADFGVPQERRRLFVLGYRRDRVPLNYPVPETDDRTGHTPTVWDAISDLPNLDDFPTLLQTDAVEIASDIWLQLASKASTYARQLRGLEPDPTDFSYLRHWQPQWLTSSLRTIHSQKSIDRFKQTPGGQIEQRSRLRRLPMDRSAHTLRAGTDSERGRFTAPRPIHPTHSRVISVREAARLHSFPDWFRFHCTKWHGFRQVGNSVPPRLGRAIGQEVMMALQCTPLKPKDAIDLGDPQLLQMNRFQTACYWRQLDQPEAQASP